LALLHSAVEREYLEDEDRRRAETSDRQGIGGSSLVWTQAGSTANKLN
jgi:hypothetical protein